MQRRSSATAALLITWLCFAAQAHAEPTPTKGGDEVTQYSFDDDAVLGDSVRPLGEVLQVRKRSQRESLVRARDSFVVELLESVERL